MNEQTSHYIETEWGLHVISMTNCLDDYETVTTTMKAIITMCLEKGLKRILCEGPKMKPVMSVMDLYQTAKNLAEWGAFGFRIAYLMPSTVGGEDALFYETVTANRAVTIKFFADKDRAVAWLKE